MNAKGPSTLVGGIIGIAVERVRADRAAPRPPRERIDRGERPDGRRGRDGLPTVFEELNLLCRICDAGIA